MKLFYTLLIMITVGGVAYAQDATNNYAVDPTYEDGMIDGEKPTYSEVMEMEETQDGNIEDDFLPDTTDLDEDIEIYRIQDSEDYKNDPDASVIILDDAEDVYEIDENTRIIVD